jgi:Secretion system C-terminal sorting domain
MKKIYTVCITMLCIAQLCAQPLLLNENFNYNTGNLGGQGSWTDGFCGFSCEENKFKVTNTTLTAPLGTSAQCATASKSIFVDMIAPFPSCGTMDNPAGQSTEKTFTNSVNSGSIFTSFLVKINLPSPAQGDIFRIGPNAFSTSLRLMARGSGSSYQFYVQSNSSSVEATDGGTRFVGTTYFVVIKYTIPTSPNNVGEIKFWVNPVATSEPALTTITRPATSSSVADPISADRIVFPHNSTCVNRPGYNMACLKIGTSWAAVTLPIELQSFTAQKNTNSNKLTWITATEKNVNRFEVERSFNGVNEWIKIGTVKATGNSDIDRQYTYNDEAPSTISYYRLRSIDNDGKEDVSKVINVSRGINKFQIASITPNPTKDNATIRIESPKDEEVLLTLSDLSGRIVLTQKQFTTEGESSININMASLSNGLYFLTLKNSEQVLVSKLIKQ